MGKLLLTLYKLADCSAMLRRYAPRWQKKIGKKSTFFWHSKAELGNLYKNTLAELWENLVFLRRNYGKLSFFEGGIITTSINVAEL
jgi:hypothetical protein